MPKRRIVFETNQPYHILSRAIEGREIFAKEEDCHRFIFQMYAASIGKPAFNIKQKDIIEAGKAILKGNEISPRAIIVEHDPLVYFLSFALVVNHNHFELVQNVNNGISKYIQKLNTSFAKYFNLKNNRKGILFESRYKAIPITTDFQFSAILRYINIKNPLDVFQPGWREKGLKNKEAAFFFLNNYPFSSFLDLFGNRKSKILAPKEILDKYFGGEFSESKEEYNKFVDDYLENQLADFQPFFLEE